MIKRRGGNDQIMSPNHLDSLRQLGMNLRDRDRKVQDNASGAALGRRGSALTGQDTCVLSQTIETPDQSSSVLAISGITSGLRRAARQASHFVTAPLLSSEPESKVAKVDIVLSKCILQAETFTLRSHHTGGNNPASIKTARVATASGSSMLGTAIVVLPIALRPTKTGTSQRK